MLRAVLICLLCLSTAPAVAAERLLVEETSLAVEIKGQAFRLPALIVREAGGGPRPVALITHGQAVEPEQREGVEPRNFLRMARDMARRGYLAVVVVRRGFGRFEGAEPYRLRPCRDGDYGPVLDDQTDDLEAAMKAIAQRPDADASQFVAMGVSVGGAAVLNLATRRPEGLKAVINVSGGIRARGPGGGPPTGCKPDDLVALFARWGEQSRLPTLWLYAENDTVFPPDYVRQLHEAYVAKGGRTDFVMFPPVAQDGHSLFGHVDGLLRWLPALDRFLRRAGLPTFDQTALDTAVKGVAPHAPIRQILARYHGRPTEKALAVGRSGRRAYVQFGGGEIDDIERTAVEQCEKVAEEPCRLVLRNFEIVAGDAAGVPEPAAPDQGAPASPP